MLLIKRAKVLLGNFWRRVNILVNDNGYIVRMYNSDKANNYLINKVDKIYNADGLLALPGIIDMHVHFREPGYEYKEDFTTGSKAALSGGVTLVADMPNNRPRINSYENYIKKINRVKSKSYVDFMLYIEIPPDLSELKHFMSKNEVSPAGVKVYMYDKAELNAFTSGKLLNEFMYIVHAEDGEFISNDFDCNSYSSFESSRPRSAELAAVKKAISIAKKGFRVHITHVTTLDALMEIMKAKRVGIKVTADVTLHHLFFTKKDGERLKSIAKCYPPLREELDRKALINSLKTGLIDAIITDHAPHAPFEKEKDLCEAPAGISSIEYFYPLLFKLANIARFRDFRVILRAVSERPANIIGLSKRGKIKVGFLADIVIFDKKIKWKVSREDAISKANLTPWEGMTLKGKVKAVFLRGELVYEDGCFMKRNGMLISRNQ